MLNRTANVLKIAADNEVLLPYQIKLGGSAAPSIVYGSNWISTVTHAAGTNVIVVTAKDNFTALVEASSELRDTTAGVGAYVSLGNIVNEGSTTALAFSLFTWTASGTTNNDATGTVGGLVLINNGNITTPGGN